MKEQKWKLLLFAVSPLFIGYLINVLMMNFGWYGISMMLLSCLFAAFWIYGGYHSKALFKSRWEANLWGNGIAVIDLCLILYQLVILGRFIPNQIGFATQMFFLPVVRISAIIKTLLFFLPISNTLGIFIISFIVMLALYNLGYTLRLRKG